MLLHWLISSSWNTPIGVGANPTQEPNLLPRMPSTAHANETKRKFQRNGVFAFPGVGDELEVLAGRDGIDGLATLAVGIGVDQRPHVHDALTLLARNLRPVVGIGRVRQILVLLELLTDRGEEVVGRCPWGRLRSAA